MSNIIESSEERISILKIGNIDKNIIKLLQENIDSLSKENKFLITNDIKEIKNSSSVITLTQIGVTKKHELIDSRKKLSLQNKNLLGIIVIGQSINEST